MSFRSCVAILTLALAGCAPAASSEQTTDTLTEPLETVEDFDSFFAVREIDDVIFERIKGKSYKEGCAVPLRELRYLTIAHYDLDGNVRKGEIICNETIADDLIDIFRNLFAARYPIESVRLIDDFDADDVKSMQANNTSCFNFRAVAGTDRLSKHARGMAIDINPLYNPWVKVKGGKTSVSPEEGRPYADRRRDFPCKIDREDLCYKEFVRHGFQWGGSWKSLKDYQHFEK